MVAAAIIAAIAAHKRLQVTLKAERVRLDDQLGSERARLEQQLEHDRELTDRTLEKAEARWVKLDAADQELTLGALRRAGTELEHAETRLAATEGALEAVPTEAPTDALLDFADALQRALRGVDTSGSMAEVTPSLAAIFESFSIHPPGHGHGLIIGRCSTATLPTRSCSRASPTPTGSRSRSWPGASRRR